MHSGYTEAGSNAMARYVLGKIRAERTLIEQDRVPYTIFRLPAVVGPEDPSLRAYFYFQRLMDGGPLILMNGSIQSIHLAYSRDLAHGYLSALTSEHAINQVYNLAQRESVRLVDWLHLAACLLEVKPTFVNIPAEVLHNSGFFYPEPLAFIATFFMNIHKAEIDLGYKTTPQAKWMENTVHWYRDFYRGPNSAGYENRQKEIEFAQMYQQAIKKLEREK
jgi:nucleoside-diphosphate-sugar epimerase